jgi:hypothetical protein
VRHAPCARHCGWWWALSRQGAWQLALIAGPCRALCHAGATFRAYHGEWVVGVATGWLLQVAAQRNQSLAPSIVAHTVMELALDAYRRRRPIPKPVSSEHVEGLHTI